MEYETPHQRYLRYADSTVGLRGKKVLEVGGCTPPRLVRAIGPLTWTSVNLNERAVLQFVEEAKNSPVPNCIALYQDITQFEEPGAFDLIYSINAFEHIHDLNVALGNLYRSLRPEGYLFALFGPIWSSDVGHHLSIPLGEGTTLHFFDGVLAPWEHLTSTPEAIHEKLSIRYGQDAAMRAVEYIFTYPDLNRLYEHEYFELVENSGFHPVLVLRRRSGSPPPVSGASGTRELLLVLKKGVASKWERLSCFGRFAWSYVRHR